jgi:uncharacterized membrane protein YphA (DoxX/SURF4 family)
MPDDGLNQELSRRLWSIKIAARAALGLVWIYEGIMPKILFVSASEIELVRNSGLYWPTPEQTLAMLGAAEIAAGVWLLSGYHERLSALITTAAIIILASLVVINEPSAAVNPYGGISKNLGLIGCAAAVWTLAPIVAARPLKSGSK